MPKEPSSLVAQLRLETLIDRQRVRVDKLIRDLDDAERILDALESQQAKAAP